MSANRIVIDAPANTIRGPWEEPGRSTLPAPVPQTDPRLELSDHALVVANTNAYPLVAQRKTRRDNLGLAAGAAIALVLGCATFVSLSSSRHAPAAAGTAVAVPNQARPIGLPPATPMPTRPVAAPPLGAPAPAGPSPMPQTAQGPGTMNMPGMAPGSAPVLVFDGSTPPMSTVTAGPNTARSADGAPALLGGALAAGGMISDNNAVHATKLAEPASTVVQGTLIPAVLETAIDTDVTGYARAVVSQDV